MPDARCPHCQQWSERSAWRDAPGQSFTLRIICPRCDKDADIDYRLGRRPETPDGNGARR